MSFLLLGNERDVVCVVCVVLTGSKRHGLQCKFRLCDILSSFHPPCPTPPRSLHHIHRAPSFPSHQPPGLPYSSLQSQISYQSIILSFLVSICWAAPSFIMLLHLQLCLSCFAFMCFLSSLWGIISNPPTTTFLSHRFFLSCLFLSLEEPRWMLQGCINK